jgi:dipeptidyl aminopeptidase/acylaminoacyl peptidase
MIASQKRALNGAFALGLCLAQTTVALAAAAETLPFDTEPHIRDIEVAASGERIISRKCSYAARRTIEDAGEYRCQLHAADVEDNRSISADTIIADDVADAAISRDGHRVAYVGPCASEQCLYVWEGRTTRNLGTATAGKLSGKLQWLSKRELIVSVPASADSTVPRQIAIANGIRTFPDGSYLISSARPQDARFVRGFTKLQRIDVATGKRETISESLPIVMTHPMVAIAPGGARLAYTRGTSDPLFVGTGGQADLILWSAATDQHQTIAHDVPFLSAFDTPVWSPDGSRLAWCQREGSGSALMVYDATRARVRRFAGPQGSLLCPKRRMLYTPILAWESEDALLVPADDAPAKHWLDSAPSSLRRLELSTGNWSLVVAAGKARWVQIIRVTASTTPIVDFVRVRPGGRAALERIDEGGKPRVLLDDLLISESSTKFSASADGSVFAYRHFDELGQTDLGLIDMRGRTAVARTSATSAVESEATTSWVTYQAAGGDRAAALVSPKPASLHKGLIVNIYPSISVADSLSEASGWPYPSLRYWLKRGYSVLYPELMVRSGRVRDDIVSGMVAALDATRRTQAANGAPICSTFLVGQSFGGYASYVLAASGLEADGAVIDAATPDWNAFFGDLNGNGTLYGYLFAATPNIGPGGTPWSTPEAYRHNSPYYDLDKTRTPILIGHGTDDQMDKFQAEIGFSALEALGKDVTLYMARRGRHGPDTFTVDQQNTFLDLMNQFFDEHSAEKAAGRMHSTRDRACTANR